MADISTGAVGLAAGAGGLLGSALSGDGGLFGGNGRGRRDGDIDSRVDTLAIIQELHRNALQTANQTNDLTNRTFEQTISLKDDSRRSDDKVAGVSREVLENRFVNATEHCGITSKILETSHKNEIATLESRIREAEKEARDVARSNEIVKGQAEIMCKLVANDAKDAFRDMESKKDAEIAKLKLESSLNQQFDHINKQFENVHCRINQVLDTNNQLAVRQDSLADRQQEIASALPTPTTLHTALRTEPRIRPTFCC